MENTEKLYLPRNFAILLGYEGSNRSIKAALCYAAKKGHIDSETVNGVIFIKDTEKSKNFRPGIYRTNDNFRKMKLSPNPLPIKEIKKKSGGTVKIAANERVFESEKGNHYIILNEKNEKVLTIFKRSVKKESLVVV